MTISWEKTGVIKNYLRMKGMESRGSSLPPMFSKLSSELARDLERARRDYPLEFASEVEIGLGNGVIAQMEEEVVSALEDRCERIWVLLSDYSQEKERLALKAKELVSFRQLQRHVGDMKRNGTSIDSKRIIFYFAHLPLDGVWTLVHSHVDAAPFPTGSDISYLPLGWLGMTASVQGGRFFLVPYRADSFEYKGTAPSRDHFKNFMLKVQGGEHRGWFEGSLPALGQQR